MVVKGPANSASVVQADVAASNGVVHVIDAVLLPKPMVMLGSSGTPMTINSTDNYVNM